MHCLLALETENVVTITDGSAKRKSQSQPTLHGLERRQTSLLLPVAGEVFFLDSPPYRTALTPKCSTSPRSFRLSEQTRHLEEIVYDIASASRPASSSCTAPQANDKKM